MTITLAPGGQTEIVEALDFKLQCEIAAAVSHCNQPAGWALIMVCGNCTFLFCARCHAVERANINTRGPCDCSCSKCNHDYGIVHRWEDIVVREVPL